MKVQKPSAQVQTTPIAASPSTQQVSAPKPSATQGSADALISAGQGAPISNAQSLGEPEIAAVGRGGGKGGAGSAKKLSADELKQIAGVGGAGLKGRGRLEGEVEKRFDKYVLVTAAEGSKSEVRFTLDLPTKDLRGLEGQKVALEGMLEKQAPWGGKITGAKFSATGPSVKVGSNQVLSGKIENRDIMGIGGEAPPSGSYLVLDKPIRVANKVIKEVFLHGEELKSGSHARLHGRIDERSWGGVETKGASYIALSGVTNEAKGEPRALVDGRFVTKKNETLEVLSYNRPMMYDAPARVFVLAGDKAFLGGRGGHIPPQMNPFHGFSGSAKIEGATAADQKALKFDADGIPHNKAGEALVRISPESDPGAPVYPDMMSQVWYFDDTNNKAYRVDNGGIAGFNNVVSATIETP
jgi:hypothetical protein